MPESHNRYLLLWMGLVSRRASLEGFQRPSYLSSRHKPKEVMMPDNNPHLKAGTEYAKDFAKIGRDTKALNARRRELAKSVDKPAK